ncbi:MAG: hypothetical protein QM715_04225 [Nibricoccus sp.]
MATVLPLRKILALVLAVLWLPTAQHCMLEAAGLLAAQEEHAAHQSCCESASGACDIEACNPIESGTYQPTSSEIVAPMPVLTVLAHLIEQSAAQETMAVKSMPRKASFDRPPDFSPTWQFVHRAAQPPRAPSLTVA